MDVYIGSCICCHIGLFIYLYFQGGDVISTILRREVTQDQKQGTCAEVNMHLIIMTITDNHVRKT